MLCAKPTDPENQLNPTGQVDRRNPAGEQREADVGGRLEGVAVGQASGEAEETGDDARNFPKKLFDVFKVGHSSIEKVLEKVLGALPERWSGCLTAIFAEQSSERLGQALSLRLFLFGQLAVVLEPLLGTDQGGLGPQLLFERLA